VNLLRFFARGVFQDDGKDIMGMSQVTFGRCIHKVTKALCRHAPRFIRFPNNEEEIQHNKIKFYGLKGMPNVCGMVDGSLVFILTPKKEVEHHYVSRKGGHAINVQFVCDAFGRFSDVVAKWPGSTHDSFMWNNCALRRRFVEQAPNGVLLGN